MLRCPVCSRDNPVDAPHCVHCDADLSGQLQVSVTGPYCPTPLSAPTTFSPNELVADRYRITARVGKGGMGVVYRAHDIRLDQDVALKLLPDRFANDPDHLARFHNEVRLARQVSHPNVCRVYDVGEHQGRVFLTMEYISGGTLDPEKHQGRIFRPDEALKIARQLCAAVAAVHHRNLLHRDLKPANILLDDQGNVRLVDFGIAALAGDVADVRSGTVGYQAPEVLAGREVTVQSDLFALGLVLYEVFTGKKAFPARDRDDLTRLHESGPVPPSSHFQSVDPAVERIIMRCLEKDPEDRPRSAEEVQAALPGALQAVVDAGQTPSPGFVADSGGIGTISIRQGNIYLGIILGGLLLCAWLTDLAGLHRRVDPRSPGYLRGIAEKLAKELGYDTAKYSADGFLVDHRVIRPALTGQQWKQLKETGRPVVMFYWYRLRPEPLVHRLSPNDIMGYGIPGMVTATDPPIAAGELCIILDGKGRLIELQARPGISDVASKADWNALFAAAGLKREKFLTEQPQRDPWAFAGERIAYKMPGNDLERELQVEGAACGGRPVYFWVGENPTESDRASLSDVPTDYGSRLSEIAYAGIRLLALTIGAWMAWRNVKRGTANLTGAGRFATFYGVSWMLMWLFMAQHCVNVADEWAMFTAAVGVAVTNSLTLWVIYLGLEPSVRRYLPQWIIGWNRLLAGRLRDPAVNRDLLVGGAFGVLWAVGMSLRRTIIPEALGMAFVPYPVWMPALTYSPVGLLASYVGFPLFFQLLEFFMLVIIYLVSGRRLIVALVVWTVFWTTRWAMLLAGPVVGEPISVALLSLVMAGVVTGLAVFTLLRFGLLAFVSFGWFAFTLVDLPVTLDRSVGYFSTSLSVLITLAALAVFAYTKATTGHIPPRSVAHDFS